MRIALLILTLVSQFCFSQSNYNRLFSIRTEEVRNLEYFDNRVVINDSSANRFFGTQSWEENQLYYTYDRIILNGKLYEAIKDSTIGKKPDKSPGYWRLSKFNYHPYYFLRDTAKVDDLRESLKDGHPYLRTYSFASLVNKRQEDIFQILLTNLNDKTKIKTMTTDVVDYKFVPDMMASYVFNSLSQKQKKKLKRLASSKYRHLDSKSWTELSR